MAKGNDCLIVLDKVKGAQLPPTPIAGRKVGGADIISLDNNPDTYLKSISGDLQDYAAMAACMMIENNRPLSVILGYLTQEERYILAGKVKAMVLGKE